MKERIRSLVKTLENDVDNEEAIEGLEEIVTGNEAEGQQEEILRELQSERSRLVQTGRFEAACKMIEFELALANDAAREAELNIELARILDDDLFNQKAALEKLKRALALRKDDEELTRKIELIEAERENWKQIVDKFVEQASEEDINSSLKAHMLYSAAERTYKNHRRGKDIPSLLYRALDTDPTHVKAARLLERILKERERWEELGELYAKLAEHRRSKDERAQMLLAAAHVCASRLYDNEAAAVYYSEVLDLVPGQETALPFLVKYYENQEDWDHLVSVYEDALAARPSHADEMAMLMQTGMIHWRMRHNMEAAEAAFSRLRKLDPSNPAMINFYRAFAEETEDNSTLIKVLSNAQKATQNTEQHDELTKEVAQIAASDGGNVERAIDAWKAVLRKEPDNEEAKNELKRLYRESEKWNALLDLLKNEAEALDNTQVEEKIAIYENIVSIYRDQLSLGTLVINTYKTILSLDPDNENAQIALTDTYEKEGRWNDLINLLNKRAKSAIDPREKVSFLLRVAHLWIERFNNLNRAVAPLEEVLSYDAQNTTAIGLLKNVYEKRRAWRPLLDLMETEVAFLEGETKKELLLEMAGLASDRISDHKRSIELWRQVLEIDPEQELALKSLEKLTERTKDWSGLIDVIERRLRFIDDDERRLSLLTKLGLVAKDRLKDPTIAADAWQRVLELQPGHGKAMRSLKEAYLASSDWESLEKLYADADDYEGLVEVLGIAADRSPDPETKKVLSFRCAELYNDPIGAPDRATRHYERVLSVEPKNARAAEALAPIYRRGEKWNRLLIILEVLLESTTDIQGRVELMDELREISAVRMNNRPMAFEWASRAFAETPADADVRQKLEESAEKADRFDALVALYKRHLDIFQDDERLEMIRHIAEIALERIGDAEEAIRGFLSILEVNPGDKKALNALENIFRANSRWEELIGIYERRIALAGSDSVKRDLIFEIANLFDEGMDEPAKAEERYRAILEIRPDDQEALLALERLVRMAEKWTDLAEILEKRRKREDIEEDEWRNTTSQLATLFDQQLENPEQSIAMYAEILDRYPADETTLDAMEHFLRNRETRAKVASIMRTHLELREDWRRLAWVLGILIESSDDPQTRLDLQTTLADLYINKLGDSQIAFSTLGAALKEHPGNRTIWNSMADIAEQLDEHTRLSDCFIEAYESGELSEELEVEMAERLAKLLDTQLGRPADSAKYYQRILQAKPNSEFAFRALETWYTGEALWQDLLGLYKQALHSAVQFYNPLDLQLKICFIHEEVEQNLGEAISAYRTVLDLDPGNQQAVRALTTLYEDSEQFEELAVLLEGELLSAAEGEEAAAIRYRLGEISERYLGREADALDYYERVVVDDPDNLKAQEAIERLLEIEDIRLRAAKVLAHTYEEQGAAEPLTRVLMITLEDDELNEYERVEVLSRVANLRERRLGDYEGAFDALSQAFTLAPHIGETRAEIGRVALENDLCERYAKVLDKVIPVVEDDKSLAALLISEVAGIYDEQLSDVAAAENAYRKLLDLDPADVSTALPAVNALERIYAGGESWEQLLDVLRTKVTLVTDIAEQTEILHRMAEIEESVLERIQNAVGLFKEILQRVDVDTKALCGLERLYERQGLWTELVEVLRQRALLEEDQGMRRDILYRIARLFEGPVGNLDEAIASYILVNEEVGPDREALVALGRLYEQTERYEDLLGIYETEAELTESDEENAALLYKMGNLLRSKLNEPGRAVGRLGEALQCNPNHEAARESLEAMLESSVRLDAIRILRPIYEQESAHEDLIRCDEIEAEETIDPLERCQIRRHAAEIAEVGLDDPKRAFAFQSRAFRDAVADPDLERVIINLERLSEIVGAHEELLQLYREVAPDILNADLQIGCYLRVAEIASLLLKDTQLAKEYYVKVLDIDGENAVALGALEEIYESSEQWVDLFEILRLKAQFTMEEDDRVDIWFKQARVCEINLEDMSGAMSIYETILNAAPQNQDAIGALERLYPKAERWSDLMTLLEKRAESGDGNQVALLHQLGNLAEVKLGDHDQALEYYKRVFEIDPNHAPTVSALEAAMDDEDRRGQVAEILEPVYKATGDWNKLVGALEAQLDLCDNPMERKGLLGRIGTLYEEQLGDLDKAFETFARLFREDIEDRASWDVLTRLASVLESWDALAEVYAAALDGVVGDTPTTAELSFVLGEIYENRLENSEKATRSYRRCLNFSPDDQNAFDAVERMLLSTESWPELLDLYRDAADAALDMNLRKDFIFKIAEINENASNDLDAAIDSYRNILDIDAEDGKAVSALDRLYEKAGRFEDLAFHLRSQIDQQPDEVERNALRCRLGQVYETKLEDFDSAVDAFEEALQEGGVGIQRPLSALENLILKEEQRRRIADILEPIYRDTDEWKKLIVILQTQVEFVDDPAEQAFKWKEIASLHSERGQNYLLAFEALAKAFEAEPTDRNVLEDMVNISENIENWDELAGVLSRVLENIYDIEFKVEVLHLLGTTYDRRLDVPRKAIDAYVEIIDINESDSIALNALEALYNLVGDWDGLVKILGMKANYAANPEDRAELLRTKASIHEDLMSSPEDAIVSYREALDSDPTSLATLDALERLYEAAGQWTELIDIKRQRVEITPDGEEQIEIQSSIASVYENRVDDAFEAITAWRAVLDLNRHEPNAIQALHRLYRKESMFPELLENLELQRELTADQSQLIEINTEIGNLQEGELSDLSGAIDSYSRVLTILPTHDKTIEALERLAEGDMVRSQAIEVLEPLHREAARWDRLVKIIELKIEILDDPKERLNELLTLAEIHESGRSEPLDAFQVYRRALAEDPSRTETVNALERLAEEQNVWTKVIETLEAQVDAVYDAQVEGALLVRLGEIKEARLHDSRGAIDAYRRALDTGLMDDPILSALDRLYESEGMWAELDEILEREIEAANDVERINLCKLRQGRIREREFGDVPGAIAAFKDVLEATPENNEAVSALQLLLNRDEFVEDVVEVLTPVFEIREEKEMISELFEHRLRVAGTDTERVQLYRELALHQEENLNDLSATFDAYCRAFEIEPEDASLLDELERLASELGSWASLVETAEQTLNKEGIDPASSVELGLRVAHWAANKVGDPAKAEKLYRAVLEKEPEHQDALVAMEDLLKNLGRFEELIPIMKKRAEASYDFADKKALYLAIAQICREELDDAAQAIEVYSAVRDLDESDLDALDALIEVNTDLDRFDDLARQLIERADYTQDLSESNRYRCRAAELYIGPLEDSQRAVEVYRVVLENDPVNGEVFETLEDLYRRLEQWNDLVDLLHQRLDTTESDEDRIAVLRKLADIQEHRLDELEDATVQLGEILLLDPDDEEAARGQERLYTKMERWQDLVELLESRADRARDVGNVDEELSLLTQMGDIWDTRLDDSLKATECYERVLDRDPEHTRALAALARLYENAEDWERCMEVLARAAQTGKGGPDEAEVHFRLARLNQTHMDNEEEAIAELLKAVDLDPDHIEANRALAEHYRKVENYEGLLEILRRDAGRIEGSEEKVPLLLEIAKLQSEHLADKDGAVVTLEEARGLDAENKDVLLILSNYYVDAGRHDDAIPVLESLIDAETDGGKKRSRKAALYHHSLAGAYISSDNREKAIEHLEAAYKLDISNLDVLISLGKLRYEQGDYDQAVKLFRALLLQRFDQVGGVTKADIYWYVGDISKKQGDLRKAKGMFQRGLDEDRDHEKCKADLAECD